MKKIKKFIVLVFCFVLVFVSFIKPFKTKAASTTHYELNVDNTALIFTFPEYYSSFNKDYLIINNNVVCHRTNNTLLYQDGTPIEPVNCYDYVWAWKITLTTQGIEDWRVDIDIFYINAKTFYNSNFEFINSITIEISSPQIEILIDYDSTLETLTGLNFDKNNIKSYLTSNSFLPGYSSIGNILNNYYNNGYDIGYNKGINEQISTQNWWSSLWNGVDAFLSVELLPNLTFGLLFAVPLVFGVLHLILFIWRSGD